MEFDLLVRKYLQGTLTPAELDRLRDLLERVPEYRSELRQILDLRSIIDDDALRLIPPKELSEKTRVVVGSRFAGIEALLRNDAGQLAPPADLAEETRLAVGRMFATSPVRPVVVDEPRRRRSFLVPFRIALGSAAVAVIIAVALAPTLLQTPELARTAGTSGIEPERLASPPAMVSSEASGVAAPSNSSATVSPRMGLASAPAAARNRPVTPRADGSAPATLAEFAPVTPVAPSATELPAIPVDGSTARTSNIDATAADLANAANLLPASGREPEYQPAHDGVGGRREMIAAMISEVPIPRNKPAGRMMAVGVTLGSGSVIDGESPMPLMQNSYYFSFSLSDADRIGVEMGGSTFMQNKSVPQPSAGAFGKGGAGDSIPVFPVSAASQPMVTRRLAQQITYGGVFYDRRINVDRSWDLCGRLTFGGADGSVVGGLRAYAAYSPTKNVTLTMGLGGSTLVSFDKPSNKLSTNYGLYYGVETGF